MRKSILILAISVFGVIASGCGSAVQSGHNTALDSVDLKSMTDQMAASIAGDLKVRAAIVREGQLRVVVQPVQNEMEAEVLPRGPAEAFTARVRFLLSGHDAKSFQWIMNRDAFYDLRNKEREDVLGPSPDAINPNYALVARFRSLTNENSQVRNSYYLCVYELTDLRDRTVLWTHPYEVEKKAVKGFLD